jgi:DNA processing protein
MFNDQITITKLDKNFSELLRQVPDCPEKLYCLGNIDLLWEKKVVAVVGSRKMSGYGKLMVEKIVTGAVGSDFVVVAGMALGVDAWVHEVCLKNKGKTIAVLAGGVERARPMANQQIYQNIIKAGGLIVSEDKEGEVIDKNSFLRRNRIVAGLSLGVVVVEGERKSGTLNTASWAGKYGREVMAVPGKVGDGLSEAPNWLIKNGAGLVENFSDIAEILGI